VPCIAPGQRHRLAFEGHATEGGEEVVAQLADVGERAVSGVAQIGERDHRRARRDRLEHDLRERMEDRAQRPAEEQRGNVDRREDGRRIARVEDLRRAVERHDRLDTRVGERAEAERARCEREHRVAAQGMAEGADPVGIERAFEEVSRRFVEGEQRR
jgi:hypothetical protein